MRRDEMIAIICDVDDQEFQSEITYRLDVEREYQYDTLSAFFDTVDHAEVSRNYGAASRRLFNVCKQVMIDIGYVIPMTQEDIDNTYSSNGRKWYFKKNNIAYDTHDYFNEPFSLDD